MEMLRSFCGRWRVLCLGLLLFVFLGCAGKYGLWLGTHKFAVVTQDAVYRSAAMPPDDLQRLVEKKGIRTVIDFRNTLADVIPEREAMEQLGVRHVHLPTEQVPDMRFVRAFLKVMDSPESYPVLIHCRHGIGRTGVFVALYRMEYEGNSNEQARHEQYVYRLGTNFEPDSSKGAFLMRYVPRRLAAEFRSSGDRIPDSSIRFPASSARPGRQATPPANHVRKS